MRLNRLPRQVRAHRGAAAVLAGLAVCLASPAAVRAAGAEGEIVSGQDLLDVCSAPNDSSAIACKFYVLGALQSASIMHAADSGQTDAPLYCANAETTTGDLINAIRGLVTAHPDRLSYPAASVVVGGAMEAYPCPHSPARHGRAHAHKKR